MRKGLVPLILVGIAVVGIVGAFIFLNQQSTKVIVTKLTFGEKGLIEDKVRFDSQVIFLQNGLWVASGEASLQNGLKGGLYQEDWDSYEDFTVWKSEGGVNIPSNDLVENEFIRNTKALFSPYLQNLDVNIEREPEFAVLVSNRGRKLETHLDIYTKSRVLNHYILARPEIISANVTKYFLFYDIGKKFTENSDGLVDHGLWEKMNNYGDHDKRDVNGYCSATSEQINELTTSDIDKFFDNLETELNAKFSSEKIKWNIEVLDSDLTSKLYNHCKDYTVTHSSCNSFTCNKNTGTVYYDSEGEVYKCSKNCGSHCGGTKTCSLGDNPDGSCTIGGCSYRTWTTHHCHVHYDRSYNYNYTVKVGIIDDEPNGGVLTTGKEEKLKMVFVIKNEIADNLCGGNHACDTGTSPAPSNPYPSKTIDQVFG